MRNNPTNFVDPSGHFFFGFFGGLVGGLLGGFFETLATYTTAGIFAAPYVSAAFEGDWATVASGILNGLAIFSGNPYLLASASLNIIADNNDYYKGDSDISKGIRVTSAVIGAAGTAKNIYNSVQSLRDSVNARKLIKDILKNLSDPSNLAKHLSADSIKSVSGIVVEIKKKLVQAEIALHVKAIGTIGGAALGGYIMGKISDWDPIQILQGVSVGAALGFSSSGVDVNALEFSIKNFDIKGFLVAANTKIYNFPLASSGYLDMTLPNGNSIETFFHKWGKNIEGTNIWSF